MRHEMSLDLCHSHYKIEDMLPHSILVSQNVLITKCCKYSAKSGLYCVCNHMCKQVCPEILALVLKKKEHMTNKYVSRSCQSERCLEVE